MWWLLAASEKDWCGDSCGRMLVCPRPALKFSEDPLPAILTVTFSPVVIEVYNTSLCTNKILAPLLWCGLRLRALCHAFCVQGCAPHPFAVEAFPSTTSPDISRSFNEKERDTILVKGYHATVNTVRFVLGCH